MVKQINLNRRQINRMYKENLGLGGYPAFIGDSATNRYFQQVEYIIT